jgi:hypothetical protein
MKTNAVQTTLHSCVSVCEPARLRFDQRIPSPMLPLCTNRFANMCVALWCCFMVLVWSVCVGLLDENDNFLARWIF